MKAPKGCNAYDREPHLHGKGNRNEVGYTREGWLNLYSLACGYQEKLAIDEPDIYLILWAEGDSFHVRAYDFDACARLFWESFDTVGEARNFFVEKAKELNLAGE